ncbi:hypothetical protein D3C77_34380 [compost metagenome]
MGISIEQEPWQPAPRLELNELLANTVYMAYHHVDGTPRGFVISAVYGPKLAVVALDTDTPRLLDADRFYYEQAPANISVTLRND